MRRFDDSVNCDRDYGKVCTRGAPGRDVVLIARHRSRHLRRRRRSQQLAYITLLGVYMHESIRRDECVHGSTRRDECVHGSTRRARRIHMRISRSFLGMLCASF